MAKKIKAYDNLDLMKVAKYRYVYEPHGAALNIFTCQEEEILIAGPKGTGKSLAVLQKIHLVLTKYPGAKGFMSRKTRASMTNSCLDMFSRHVIKPADKVKPHKQDQQYHYPNGSVLAYVGLDDPMRLQSSEWDIGYIQEATEVSENDWEMCTGLLRSGIVPYQQLIGDCNPDKPTHWLKKRCDQNKTYMLLSVHQDNPKYWNHAKDKPTELGKKYFGKLSRLSGHRRERLYLGKWAAAEGMIYDKWDPNVHLVNRVDMPRDHERWNHYWSIDWGHVHPMVIQDWIEDPVTGALYLNWEFYKTGWLVEDAARYVREKFLSSYIPLAVVCDHDLEDRKVFERHTGLLTLAAYKPIQPGIQAVQTRLGWDENSRSYNWKGTGKPGIFLIRDCLDSVDADLAEAGLPTSTEAEVDGYVWDEDHNRRVNSKKDELPVDLNNHGCDAKRYIVGFHDDLALDPEEIEGIIPLGDMDEVHISPW